ncbi:MAG: hypothetical protein IJJ33_04895, partial [Victivallales bacterium]|nr:hypothetical protein [Victivallales bacterium]
MFQNWLKQHQILAGLLALFLVAQCIVLFLLLIPAAHELEDTREEVDYLFKQLRGRSWPLDGPRLNAFLEQLLHEQQATTEGTSAARCAELMAQATATFLPSIEQDYGGINDFITGATRLEYQSTYNRITRELADQGIILHPSILGLGEDVSTSSFYQPIMQLWTVERLVKLANHCHLAFESRGLGNKSHAARITALPITAYTVGEGKQERPYLVAFPVKITVKGELRECLAFLQSLQREGTFLPPRAFELQALPPTKVVGDQKGQIQ